MGGALIINRYFAVLHISPLRSGTCNGPGQVTRRRLSAQASASREIAGRTRGNRDWFRVQFGNKAPKNSSELLIGMAVLFI